MKSGTTRSIAPFVEHLARSYFTDPADAYGKGIVRFTAALNDVYGALYESDMFLIDPAKEKLRNALHEMGKAHMKCRAHANTAHEFAFQLEPKAHYAHRLYMQSRLVNSRETQCYQWGEHDGRDGQDL